jgi:hypothetical protein
MRTATNLGLVAAILLITTLVTAALNAIFRSVTPLQYVSAGCAIIGLVLIIVAAIVAIRENSIIQRAIDSDLLDVPELAKQTGQRPVP